jgi:uncharacterized protein (UPF0128 family)
MKITGVDYSEGKMTASGVITEKGFLNNKYVIYVIPLENGKKVKLIGTKCNIWWHKIFKRKQLIDLVNRVKAINKLR